MNTETKNPETKNETVYDSPICTIDWSENSLINSLKDEGEMPLYVANMIIRLANLAHILEHGYHSGYDKTGFTIKMTYKGELQEYEGQYDIGCDSDDLLSHIKDHYQYFVDHPNIGFGPDTKELDYTFNEYIPALENHVKLQLLEAQLNDFDVTYNEYAMDLIKKGREQINNGNFDIEWPMSVKEYEEKCKKEGKLFIVDVNYGRDVDEIWNGD